MAYKIFWFDEFPSRATHMQTFSHLDIYHLCSATPDSHAERLYDKTKEFLEGHCQSIQQVIYRKSLTRNVILFFSRILINPNRIH